MSGWSEALHPRAPKGTPLGGQFSSGAGTSNGPASLALNAKGPRRKHGRLPFLHRKGPDVVAVPRATETNNERNARLSLESLAKFSQKPVKHRTGRGNLFRNH